MSDYCIETRMMVLSGSIIMSIAIILFANFLTEKKEQNEE